MYILDCSAECSPVRENSRSIESTNNPRTSPFWRRPPLLTLSHCHDINMSSVAWGLYQMQHKVMIQNNSGYAGLCGCRMYHVPTSICFVLPCRESLQASNSFPDLSLLGFKAVVGPRPGYWLFSAKFHQVHFVLNFLRKLTPQFLFSINKEVRCLVHLIGFCQPPLSSKQVIRGSGSSEHFIE